VKVRPPWRPRVFRTGDPGKAGALFDLQSDPGEQRDVSAQHPDVVARLRRHFNIVNADVPVVAAPRVNPGAAVKK
jgi:hypothetical protein